MLGWHVYRGIDLKIPTRLPRVAIYITSSNLLTCCCSNSRETTCLDYPGNPQTKKKSITAQPDKGIHLKREKRA